jgi:hypothetical protein
MCKHGHHKTTAIESGSASPGPTIGNTQESFGVSEQFCHQTVAIVAQQANTVCRFGKENTVTYAFCVAFCCKSIIIAGLRKQKAG